MFHIEPVHSSRRRRALRFLACGRSVGPEAEVRADAYEQFIAARAPLAVRFWQARRWRRIVAAAMVAESPGRTGMLFHTPADAPGVDAEALGETIAVVTREALTGGLSMVQALTDPAAPANARVVAQAGYERLAELIYMRRLLDDLAAGDDECDVGELTWRSARECDAAELGDVIAATYHDSLDCPPLAGVRELSDTVAGHRAVGEYRPQAWWIVSRGGDPAGVILVNDFPDDDAAEVVYMGVVPSCRGAGLGRAMLRRACRAAAARGMEAMRLAVDSENRYAMVVYSDEGFVETRRRLAYAAFARSFPAVVR